MLLRYEYGKCMRACLLTDWLTVTEAAILNYVLSVDMYIPLYTSTQEKN